MTRIIERHTSYTTNTPESFPGRCAWECQFTYKNPDPASRWRVNKQAIVVATTAEQAIAAIREMYPDELVVHQVILRSHKCDIILVEA